MHTHSHRHRHKVHTTDERPFEGCACPGRCTPEAHGGVMLLEHCRCGAQRQVNSNGGRLETGRWQMPEGGEN